MSASMASRIAACNAADSSLPSHERSPWGEGSPAGAFIATGIEHFPSG